ncbi:MAG: hypothetical protein ACREOI_22300 [bacterium]
MDEIQFLLVVQHIAATNEIENFQFAVFNTFKIKNASMDFSEPVGAFVFLQ